MPSVAWAYDGGSGGTGVLTATITGATVGWKYKLGTWGVGTTQIATAASSTVVLSITDYNGLGGQWISWVGDDHGVGSFPGSGKEEAHPIDTALFLDGTPGEQASDPSITVTYDGVKTFTLATTHAGGTYFQLGYVDIDAGDSFTEESISPTGPGSFPLVLSGTPADNVSVDVELDPSYYDSYAHGIFVYTGPAPILLEAEDDYNSDPLYAATVTNSGVTYVTVGSSPETYDEDSGFDLLVDGGNCHPTFYIRNDRLPPAGRYSIQLKLRGSSNGTTAFNEGWVVVRRNGLSITPTVFVGSPLSGDEWRSLSKPWISDITGLPADGGAGPTAFPFLPGDVYEFCLFDQNPDSTMAVDRIRLDLVEAGGSSSLIPMLAPPEYATGSTWTDVDAMTDATKKPLLLDICITDDGTVYAAWLQGLATGSNAANNIVVRSFNGSTWTTLSSDLAGHGTGPLDTWINCKTDGTNVYVLFGDRDGTSVSSGSNRIAGSNRVWRVKKWNGSTWSELGTGQRDDATRTKAFADLGNEGNPLSLFISPAGVPWVAWGEQVDSLATDPDHGNVYPHCWRWSGSAWADTSLTVDHHIHNYYTTCIVSNCNEYGMVFADPDGSPSENPCLIFCYQDGTGSDPAFIQFQFQKWNGSAWANTLDFSSYSVWPDLRDRAVSPFHQHFHQGLHMFVWQDKVWMSAALINGFSSAVQGSMAYLASDLSVFVAPDKPYWDRAAWNSEDPDSFSDSIREGWAGDGTTTGPPAVDSEGNLWFALGSFFTGYDTDGVVVYGRQENGTGDGMTIAWRDPIDTANGGPNGGTYGEFQFSDAGFAFYGTTAYIMVHASSGSDDPLLLYKCVRDDPYGAWAAAAGLRAWQRF